MILPGATLGLLGGGQLGRMFTVAARTMGYRVMVLDPDLLSPAAEMANEHLCADYGDERALARLAAQCAAVTTEFENPPAASLEELSRHCLVRPSAHCVAIAQDRAKEKSFLAGAGFAVAPYAAIECVADLQAAFAEVGFPAVLKVSRLGYDGKGQVRVETQQQAREAFESLQGAPCVMEQFLTLKLEVSVILARSANGQTACFSVAENRHSNGILDLSIVPARISADLAGRAQEIAIGIGAALGYCGVLAVEFFVLDDDTLVVNEIAPRPHNSGHFTLDACITSQFEQQVRTLCGLPLGNPKQHTAAVMVNLLGDVWNESSPHWEAILGQPDVKLHLYGKREPRPGRKMGHFTVYADALQDALDSALAIRAALASQ
jgi:5-(carboxyamino)imidazole ribonucleotide synthase